MAHTISHGTNTCQSESSGNDNCTRDIITRNYARFFNAKTTNSVSIICIERRYKNYCKFELQSPDNMTIVNKLLYIDSYYLASMVKGGFETTSWQKVVSKQLFIINELLFFTNDMFLLILKITNKNWSINQKCVAYELHLII